VSLLALLADGYRPEVERDPEASSGWRKPRRGKTPVRCSCRGVSSHRGLTGVKTKLAEEKKCNGFHAD